MCAGFCEIEGLGKSWGLDWVGALAKENWTWGQEG